MSAPGPGQGGRGRAGSKLRCRVYRPTSPGRGGSPTPPISQLTLADAASSSSSSSQHHLSTTDTDSSTPSLPPKRGRSPTSPEHSPTRGLARGSHPALGRQVYSVTKPESFVTKAGKLGEKIAMLANFFVLTKAPAWSLHLHRVDFEPALDDVRVRGAMIRQHEEVLGAYMYDNGDLIRTLKEIPNMDLLSVDQKDPTKKYKISIKFVSLVEPGDGVNIAFYNSTLRRCLFKMGLEEFGRSFFNSKDEKRLEQHRLKLWPGVTTSIRNHEDNVLLCVETTHKVLRLDNVMQSIEDIQGKARQGQDPKQACVSEIVGTVVMTTYSNKTYGVSDIAWDLSPETTFDMKGVPTTYLKYYESKYGLKIANKTQPLLLAVAKKKDFHRGANQADKPEPVYLVPELCQMTGLTEGMRSNFSLMKDLAQYLHEGPDGKIATLKKFIKRLRATPENMEYLRKWGVDFMEDLVSLQGRVMDNENISFGNGALFPADKAKADWTFAFRNQKMLSSVNLSDWVVIVTDRDSSNVDMVVNKMISVAKPLGFIISKPKIMKIRDSKVSTYIQAIQQQSQNSGLQMMFIFLVNNNASTYGAIKKKLSAEIGMPSQCFLTKHFRNEKGLMSICTKVVIQMNAKLGGEPWSVKIPLKKMMTVGYDVYHGGKLTGSRNVGAMVASVSPTHATYFSTVSFFSSTDEMSRTLTTDMIKCLEAYAETNEDTLPERIIFYRDGVGDGQLETVYRTELVQLLSAIHGLYGNKKLPNPKLTVVVVSKRINTRLFRTGRGKADNPPPGTVCDTVVTLPERYDFFLIPQTARQGAVSPTSFNVIYDSNNLDPDKMQKLTFKMCHLYFNWSGTVAVPAPCQYAHKLAYQTGLAIGDRSNSDLAYKLHFL